MGFSFAAFFFFVLITRTTDLDYDSESSVCLQFTALLVYIPTTVCVCVCSPSDLVGRRRSGGRGAPGDELVALRFGHGVHRRGRPDARIPHCLHRPFHSNRYGTIRRILYFTLFQEEL